MIQIEGIRLGLPAESLKSGLRILSYSLWGQDRLTRRYGWRTLGFARVRLIGIGGIACLFPRKAKVAWASNVRLGRFDPIVDSWRQRLTHRRGSPNGKAMGSG